MIVPINERDVDSRIATQNLCGVESCESSTDDHDPSHNEQCKSEICDRRPQISDPQRPYFVTMSFFIGPSTPSNCIFSAAGTLNLSRAPTGPRPAHRNPLRKFAFRHAPTSCPCLCTCKDRRRPRRFSWPLL